MYKNFWDDVSAMFPDKQAPSIISSDSDRSDGPGPQGLPSGTVFQTVKLPGGEDSVSLPEGFIVEMENDLTLRARLPGEEMITLRFACRSVPGKIWDVVRYIKKEAGQRSCPWGEIDDKTFLSFEEDGGDGATPLRKIFWEVGCRSTVVHVFALIGKKYLDHPEVCRVLGAMPAILRSLVIGAPVARLFDVKEQQWLKSSLDRASVLNARYGAGRPYSPENLDSIFVNWSNDTNEDKCAADEVAEALGAVFGDLLELEFGFAWVLEVTEHGLQYCLLNNFMWAHPYAGSLEDGMQLMWRRDYFANLYYLIVGELEG